MNCGLKAVVFDFDGTLVDSGPGIVEAIRLTLSEVGRAPLSEETLYTCVGPPIYQFFPMVLGLEGEDMVRAIGIYKRIFDEVALPTLKPYPGIIELLSDVKAAGLLTGIATCKVRGTCISQAQMLGIAPYIDVYGGSLPEENLFEKGDILKTAMVSLNVAGHEALMVGDRKYDLIGANEAGVPALGVLYGCGSREELMEHDPLAIVETVAELRAFILGNGYLGG